ncbi:MAG: hypothetical protein CSA15_08260 [Candidatus Delongbacteria bacterium]|nr:MAG: hypothetical protein CSA15_08260 [Candidatus Delongbacteria bacterium]
MTEFPIENLPYITTLGVIAFLTYIFFIIKDRIEKIIAFTFTLISITCCTFLFVKRGGNINTPTTNNLKRSDPNILTEAELKTLKNISNSISLDKGVSELLMVGIPSDHKNKNCNKNIEHIVNDLNIRNLFLNKYNFYRSKKDKDDTYFLSVKEFISYFHKMIRTETGKKMSPQNIPLVIACDFESPTFTSIPHKVNQSPSALTIACTQDSNLIRDIGNYNGYQLRSLGVDILLGPVLDASKPFQYMGKKNRTSLRNRSFAKSQETVYNIATHYVLGVKESGIKVIGKHFPSHGAVCVNSHSWCIPKYKGSIDNLKDEWSSFRGFNDYLDGVMTSHIGIECLLETNSKPVTLSNFFVSKILKSNDKNINLSESNIKFEGLGYENKVILTDDLSDMGSIRKYMHDENMSFGDIAIEAYKAGHDMLLYSHIETKNNPPRGKITVRGGGVPDSIKGFTLKDLEDVHKRLLEYVKKNEPEFRKRLLKILRFKAEIIKSRGGSIEDGKFLYPDINWVDSEFSKDSLPVNLKKKFNSPASLLDSVFIKSTLLINKKNNYVINELPKNTDILFCIYNDYIDEFKQSFSFFENADFLSIPITKSGNSWKELEKKFYDLYENKDIIVYTLKDDTDADFIERAISHFKKENNKLQNFILFIHAEPNILGPIVFNNSTIIGNFSFHEYSFKTDLKVLNGEITPSSKEKLTVGIGMGAEALLKPKGTDILPAEGFNPMEFPQSAKEKEFCKIIASQKEVIRRYFNNVSHLIFILILTVLFFTLLMGRREFDNINKYIMENIQGKRSKFVSFLSLIFSLMLSIIIVALVFEILSISILIIGYDIDIELLNSWIKNIDKIFYKILN